MVDIRHMEEFVADIKIQQNKVIEDMLGEAIAKGIISVRQSDPVLVLHRSLDSPHDKVKLHQSAVIDYHGSEVIEELEKTVAYLTKINTEIHNALFDFYEQTKANTWLKNQSP